MNDQTQMMNQPPPPPQLMMSESQVMNPVQVRVPVQAPQILNHKPILVQSQAMNQQCQLMLRHNQAMRQQQPPPPPLMSQRPYKPWNQQQSSMDSNPMKLFQNQQPNNPLKFNSFVPSKPRSNWKGKNVNMKDQRRMEKPMPSKANNNTAPLAGAAGTGPSVSGGGYKPPSLNELQTQNRMKARKYYHPKKKFNNRFAPYAPRNTSSFIIRAKKAGGITSLVSPCPVTPAVLPTPLFSPSREVLGDMAKEEWGVDGYGSMKGLIRLRSPGHEADGHDEEDDDEGNGSSESDVEEHVEVERRLDHDLSRFEMIYPNYGGGESYNNVLENRVDDQDTHIAQLEEENLTLKERLFLMERELGDLRRRLQFLERQQGRSAMVIEDVNEDVVGTMSENDENDNGSDGEMDVGVTAVENNKNVMDYACENGESRDNGNYVKGSNAVRIGDIVHDDVPYVQDEVENQKSGCEFIQKNVEKVTVKENEANGGKIGDGSVATSAVMVTKDEARNDEAMNEMGRKEDLSKLDGDDAMYQHVNDKAIEDKDELRDGKACLEKSIDSGDN